MTEEIKMIAETIGQLGEHGVTAFIWWCILKFGTHLLWCITVFTLLYAITSRITKACEVVCKETN